jgi:hypothetical protein
VLLKLGQGRVVSEGLLPLTCVSVLGSHGHHLRDVECHNERGSLHQRVRGGSRLLSIMCSAAAQWQGRRAQLKGLTVTPPGC